MHGCHAPALSQSCPRQLLPAAADAAACSWPGCSCACTPLLLGAARALTSNVPAEQHACMRAAVSRTVHYAVTQAHLMWRRHLFVASKLLVLHRSGIWRRRPVACDAAQPIGSAGSKLRARKVELRILPSSTLKRQLAVHHLWRHLPATLLPTCPTWDASTQQTPNTEPSAQQTHLHGLLPACQQLVQLATNVALPRHAIGGCTAWCTARGTELPLTPAHGMKQPCRQPHANQPSGLYRLPRGDI